MRKEPVFIYCEPRHSEQKGGIEKNHEYIRYICPKGTSFNDFTQEKVNKMIDHINSTARPCFHGKSSIEAAIENFGMKTVEKLGLHQIEADEVGLSPV